ncbi:HPr family phosphocarrier protein [Lachnobacterium bovis]|uniref:Phosphocarrier protein HPr n=1 Tax=Lachnobacterium bovis TaxID=140626 RepID=A0A1H9UGS2_9FIRM|nr:HPr family phosphocarrier protein [Lachnobacterium bovis]SES08720.1 phosphocarrier protein [Lachnobacterium bovis]
MQETNVIVSNWLERKGNPIAELVQLACQFQSNIILESNEKHINAKSIMGIMAFNPTPGSNIQILANGEDESEAVESLSNFLSN